MTLSAIQRQARHDADTGYRIAVLAPCYNEAVTIARVVREFQAALPGAAIYVYDNNSRDDTCAVARRAGAIVRSVARQGKGNVVRRMFADIDADIYVMVDGDATYHAPSATQMISRLVEDQLDMVVGCRESTEPESYRMGHRFGNRLLTGCVAYVFGRQFTDILSGYRVFSKRFVKSFPALAEGFETETELTVHALELRMPIGEVPTPYGARPEGSVSKLSTYRDGWRILNTIVRLFRAERPLAFFGYLGFALALLSLVLAWPLAVTYAETGLVPRLPTAVLATGTMLAAVLSWVCGIILDTVTRARQEIKRLSYLALPPIRQDPQRMSP
jgi:glycosyltransferase involved in cell wall biosynthesis